MTLSLRLTPLSDVEAEGTRSRLIQYWIWFDQQDDLTGVPGDLVYETRAKVMELLQTNQPADVYEADRLTTDFEFNRRRLYS